MMGGTYPGMAAPRAFGGRSATFVITKSNPALPIPSWAQNGNGIVLVSGVGGGGSSGGGASGGGSGQAGGAGAWALKHPVLIPPGHVSCAAIIGAGGLAPAAGSSGTAGGSTSLAFGAITPISLGGGNGGSTDSSSVTDGGAVTIYGSALSSVYFTASDITVNSSTLYNALRVLLINYTPQSTYGRGLGGGVNIYSAAGTSPYNVSASISTMSLFGGGQKTAPFGYGFGGGQSDGSGHSGRAGGNGLLILEFIEVKGV